jgi:hypothetical protein
LALVACAAALSAAAARAQTDTVLPAAGMEAFNQDYRKHRDLAVELIRGTRSYDAGLPNHLEALDAEAKSVTYRFTWVTVQNQPNAIDTEFQRGIARDVDGLKKGRPGTAPAIQIYSAKVIEHAKEVLSPPGQKLIAKVNAARVLAKLAELGPPELADTLVAILDSDQSDAVKLPALKGLEELASFQPPVLTPEREKKVAEALATFIERKMTIADTTTPEEVEGFQYVRLAAVRALARIHNPGAADRGRGPMALLRVVAKDGLVPSPRIDERVEAAIGIARLKPSLDKEYNPDYALAQVGLFLDDFNQNVTGERERKRAGDSPATNLSLFPLRIFAARLYDAIDLARAEPPDNPAVTKITGECLALLSKVERGDPADPERIFQAIAGPPAPAARLFKNVEDSTVRPANRRDEGAGGPPAARGLETRPPPPGKKR